MVKKRIKTEKPQVDPYPVEEDLRGIFGILNADK